MTAKSVHAVSQRHAQSCYWSVDAAVLALGKSGSRLLLQRRLRLPLTALVDSGRTLGEAKYSQSE
jgi:hypothetical protein